MNIRLSIPVAVGDDNERYVRCVDLSGALLDLIADSASPGDLEDCLTELAKLLAAPRETQP